jgi:predicted DNA-binding protein (MmcQ/YjbR family)
MVEPLSELCLSLPEATSEQTGRHVTFRVRKKVFAYYLDDHHGDGIVGLVCKLGPGQAAELIASDPARYYRPAYLGHHGWVGLRLDTGSVDWEEVASLVTDSYLLVAPKRLGDLAVEQAGQTPG